MPEAKYCARHPETLTNVSCNRCDAPVCPQCMIHSPVGIRCPDCGQATPLPTYEVSTSHLVRAVAASVLIGLGGGLVVGLILGLLHLGLFLFALVMAGFGYVVSEGVSRASDQKQGRSLQIVAAGGVLIGGALALIVSPNPIHLFDLIGVGLGVYVSFIRLR